MKRHTELTQEVIRGILEVAPFGIYVVSKNGGIDYVNSAMIIMSGDTFEQFTSLNVFEHPTYKEIGLDEKIRAIFEGEPFQMKSVKYTAYYSKITTIRDFIGIPVLEGGEKKALIFVADITQIKKAEEEIIAAMNIKSRFVSLVSHELRTPLALIKMYINSVINRIEGDLNDKQKEYLDIAEKNIDRLNRLVNDVLDHQRLEIGRLEFKMEKGDINELLEEAAGEISLLVESKGLDLNVSVDKDLPKITFDRDKIKQVLINLLNNAMKVTTEGGITVTSFKAEDTVGVSVADTGTGIKQEDMPKLFKEFSQISRSSVGTGLGLAISKKIIERHNGRIEVVSEYGKGSTFSFYLPDVWDGS